MGFTARPRRRAGPSPGSPSPSPAGGSGDPVALVEPLPEVEELAARRAERERRGSPAAGGDGLAADGHRRGRTDPHLPRPAATPAHACERAPRAQPRRAARRAGAAAMASSSCRWPRPRPGRRWRTFPSASTTKVPGSRRRARGGAPRRARRAGPGTGSRAPCAATSSRADSSATPSSSKQRSRWPRQTSASAGSSSWHGPHQRRPEVHRHHLAAQRGEIDRPPVEVGQRERRVDLARSRTSARERCTRSWAATTAATARRTSLSQRVMAVGPRRPAPEVRACPAPPRCPTPGPEQRLQVVVGEVEADRRRTRRCRC